MHLTDLQHHWNRLGEDDPLYWILTTPKYRNRRWDLDLFFKSGCIEINRVRNHLESLGLTLSGQRALDFGCGVGRVTQALAPFFEVVVGVDLASSMIKLANQHNKYPGRCGYSVNEKPDLSVYPDRFFDFVYSNLVLQHMEPSYAESYIREFLRVAKPGGVVLFQLPSQKIMLPTRTSSVLKARIKSLANRLRLGPIRDEAYLEMYETPKEVVLSWLKEHAVRAVTEDPHALPERQGFLYCLTKTD